jgi:hypothetical protein
VNLENLTMPSPIDFVRLAVLGTSILAFSFPPIASAQAPAAPPAATAAKTLVRQFSLRAVNPTEAAAILTVNYGVIATGSPSTGTVTVTADEKRMGEIASHLEQLDQMALERREDRHRMEQQERQIAENLEREKGAVARDIVESKSISIDFPGGTVGEYLALVSKTSKFGNIIIGDERINALRMPAVRVRKITGAAAVMLLQNLRFTAGEASAAIGVQHVPGDPEGHGIDAESVFVLDLLLNEQAPRASAARTEVFDLQAQKRQAPESLPALIDALRTAIELQGASQHFKLSLHDDTGLLFVRGTPIELDVAIRTVQAFTGK